MTVEDLFTIQTLGPVAVSPDGASIAAVIQRAATDGESYGRPYLLGNDRADVWLLSRGGAAPDNLTQGVRDRSGFWEPRWSPDGRRLALLSTRGGDNVRLYLWDARHRTVVRITDRAVDLNGRIDAPDGQSGPYVWLGPTTLLVNLLPAGRVAPRFDISVRGPRAAAREWLKVGSGSEPTASVLESDPDAPPGELPLAELQLIDVERRTSRVIVTVPYRDRGFRAISLSPDKLHAALLAGVEPVSMDREHRLGNYRLARTRLGVFTLGGGNVRWVGGGIYSGLQGWSPDGSELAVAGKLNEGDDSPPHELFFITTQTGVARRTTPAGWRLVWHDPLEQPHAPAVVWTTDGRPIVHLQAEHAPAHGEAERSGWWRLEPDGNQVEITSGMKSVPAALRPVGERDTYIGVADGALWKIDVVHAAIVSLTADLALSVTSVVEPEVIAPARPLAPEVVVATEESGQERYARVPLAGGRTEVVPTPSSLSTLKALSPGQQLAVFTEVGPNGSFVWSGDGHSTRFSQLLAVNEHLAKIADAKRLLIAYRGTDGDSINGLVLLPPNYEPSHRSPLIVWVYAGLVVRDTLSSFGTTKNEFNPLGLALLPLIAHGYAVLIPSIPLPPEGTPSDPYIELPKGVMPAVDKAIELGIADPNRMGVMGISYGGYSTYSLVTYTNRFKAAVALSGLSDLISLYGEFDVRERFTDTPHETLFMPMHSEGGQFSLGAPPWDNLWRYLRNSPLFFIDRVHTPVLIVQGDQDFVSMTQSEEFFTGLYRQGKRARFIRYWGEDHVISSPANVRHMWGEIFTWFDTYLRAPNSQ
jgi:dipeptidyl aminopeptidase/acylaminoacyl peptidase